MCFRLSSYFIRYSPEERNIFLCALKACFLYIGGIYEFWSVEYQNIGFFFEEFRQSIFILAKYMFYIV